MSACAMDDKTRWEEEIRLSNGQRLMVERTQTRDPFGSREIGQPAPRSEETLKFKYRGNPHHIIWKSDFGRETQANLSLLALDIVGGIPFIVTYPTRCHAYNKWGRPNPPYVFFKFDGTTWQRISLNELPKEIKRANVIIGGYSGNERVLIGLGIPVEQATTYFSIESVDRFNSDMTAEAQYLRVFSRQPLKPGSPGVSCPDYSSPRYMSPKAPNPITPPSTDSGQ